MTKLIEYRKTKAAARKLIEARQDALSGFVGVSGLLEKLLQLDLDALPEAQDRHTTGYVGAVVEFAAQHSHAYRSGRVGAGDDEEDDVERNDPRAFAEFFLKKRPEYSRTSNGLAASRFEAWLQEKSGHLLARFVETVLEKGDKFVAIFEGKLNSEETRRMRSGTAPFMAFETLIEAGQNNGEEIFEFTIFDCTAKAVEKRDAEPQLQGSPPPIDGKQDDVKAPAGTVGPRHESLLPSTRAEYEAVYEEGGVTANALAVTLGVASLEDAWVETPSGHRIVDENGVVWESPDSDVWLPQADGFDDASETSGLRNYREAEGVEGNCGGCRYFRRSLDAFPADAGVEGSCELVGEAVWRDMVCDDWGARQEGLAEDADFAEDPDEELRRVVSDYGTWELREDAVGTVVAVDACAWTVPQPFDEVLETITDIGAMYDDALSEERDVTVEGVLSDFASESGVPCARPEALVEDQREERDAAVHARNAARLHEAPDVAEAPDVVRRWADVVEMSVRDVSRRWAEAGARVTAEYPDVSEGSERWHQTRVGIFAAQMRGELDERQRVAPHLALASEPSTTRPGGFKVSAKMLKLWRTEVPDFELKDSLFRQVRDKIGAIPRPDLPKLFGVSNSDASALPAAQDVVARQPRKAFKTFLRSVSQVSPALHGYLQRVPGNAPIIFHLIVTRLSGEDMANLIFKRYFLSSGSGHPGAVSGPRQTAKKRMARSVAKHGQGGALDRVFAKFAESLPEEDDLYARLEEEGKEPDDEKPEKEAEGKKR